METVIFNADFEWQLFQQKQNFKSTKKTQEFEYLINWVEPQLTIYTTKDYPKEYQRWFFKFNHESFKFSDDDSSISPWCGNYDQIELKRKLQDQSKTLNFAAQYNLGPQSFSLINDPQQIEPGFLYKYPKSLSGMGHYHYQDREKMENFLRNGEVLTKEKILNRVLDFSTLWEDCELKYFYRNIVTDNYQYRGTLIEKDISFLTKEQKEYFESKKHFLNGWIDNMKGILTIDSFLYEVNGEREIYFLSEVNCRKTMGYTAIHLAKKFFPDASLVKFVFGNYKLPVKDYEKLYVQSNHTIIPISPDEHKFKCFLIAGESENDIFEKENLLF